MFRHRFVTRHWNGFQQGKLGAQVWGVADLAEQRGFLFTRQRSQVRLEPVAHVVSMPAATTARRRREINAEVGRDITLCEVDLIIRLYSQAYQAKDTGRAKLNCP